MINILYTCRDCDFDGAVDVLVEGYAFYGNLTYKGQCPQCHEYFTIDVEA